VAKLVEATSQKVSDSNPDIIGNVNWHNPSDSTTALHKKWASNGNDYQHYFLGVMQPVCRADLTIFMCWLPPVYGSLNSLQPSGPVISLYRDCFNFSFTYQCELTDISTQQFQKGSLIFRIANELNPNVSDETTVRTKVKRRCVVLISCCEFRKRIN